MSEDYSLPRDKFVCEMKHKYAVGDKVHVPGYVFNSTDGEIVALLPYTLVAPAYYVRLGGIIAAVSERSIMPITAQEMAQ